MRLLALGYLALTLHAQQPPPSDLLPKVRARVAETVRRLTNYMCTETVDRSQYVPTRANTSETCAQLLEHRAAVRLFVSDRLRLDVGIGSTGEIYSWAGENHFHDRALSEIVNQGSISTGSFASFLSVIFDKDHADFTYQGEATFKGRKLASFSYQVPLAGSHYSFSNKARHLTAYEGTLLVDPKTNDLVQLVVRTKDLAPETGTCEAATTLEYTSVPVNGVSLMLPADTRLSIVNRDGQQDANRTVFSNCHAFLGESVVSYDDPALPDIGAKVAAGPIALPDGLRFDVAITQAIPSTTVAVGDTVPAALASAIRDHTRTYAPKGAPVLTRVIDLKRYYSWPPRVELSLRLETVTIKGASQPLAATPVRISALPPGAGRPTRIRYEDPLPFTEIDGKSVIVLPDNDHNRIIPKGSFSTWTTGAPAAK